MADIIEQEHIYVDINGNEHQIYPMLLDDNAKASRLFNKLKSDEILFLNLPTSKLNRVGNPIIDKKTKEPVLDYTAYNAMIELFKLALKEPQKEIEQWVDLKNGAHILDEYRQISGVKKKIQQAMAKEILTLSSQQ